MALEQLHQPQVYTRTNQKIALSHTERNNSNCHHHLLRKGLWKASSQVSRRKPNPHQRFGTPQLR
jgi:hypothetical protein